MENKNLENIENNDAVIVDETTETTSAPTKEKKPSIFKKFIAIMKSRKTKYGSLSVAITAIVVALVILINVAFSLLAEKFPNMQLDFTLSQSYQLQKDTVKYMKMLDQDVTIYVLASKDAFISGLNAYNGANYFVQAEKLLNKMDALSDHINIEYVDLSENPTFYSRYPDVAWDTSTASKYLFLLDAEEDYNTLNIEDCFSYDEQYISYGYYYWTGSTIEQAIVTGLLDVTTAEKVKVEFITGAGQSEDIYTYLKSHLKKNAYDVSDMNLTTEDLSKDTKIAIMYAPTVDITEDGVEKLDDWLTNNGQYGKTLIYIPLAQEIETPNLDSLLAQYGMKVENELAFTTSDSYFLDGNPYMFITDYIEDEEKTFTKELKNASVPVIMYDSRAISIIDDSMASSLLKLKESAGSLPFDTDTTEIQSYEDFDKYINKDGITVAAIGTKSKSQSSDPNVDTLKSNIAVFGSYTMFYSQMLSSTSCNNANYISNFCNTVANRKDLGVTITSADTSAKELGVIEDSTKNTVGTIFIGVVPAIILIIGLVIFIRRRNS